MEAAQWWDMKGQTHLPGIVGKKLVGEKKTGVTWRRLKGSLCILNDIIYVVYINPFLYNVYVYIYMYITFVCIRSKRYCCLNIPNMAYPLWRVLSDKFSEGRNGEPLNPCNKARVRLGHIWHETEGRHHCDVNVKTCPRSGSVSPGHLALFQAFHFRVFFFSESLPTCTNLQILQSCWWNSHDARWWSALIFVGKVSLKVECDTLHGSPSGINRTNQCECVRKIMCHTYSFDRGNKRLQMLR